MSLTEKISRSTDKKILLSHGKTLSEENKRLLKEGKITVSQAVFLCDQEYSPLEKMMYDPPL